jgi:hypothetical protein
VCPEKEQGVQEKKYGSTGCPKKVELGFQEKEMR